jgi:hypothetical protein
MVEAIKESVRQAVIDRDVDGHVERFSRLHATWANRRGALCRYTDAQLVTLVQWHSDPDLRRAAAELLYQRGGAAVEAERLQRLQEAQIALEAQL